MSDEWIVMRLLTCTSPSLFSRVSLLPVVLLSAVSRSCMLLSQAHVVCSVSSKDCCSCRLSWQLRRRSLTAFSRVCCCICSCVDTRNSEPLPWPPSIRVWASWHRLSKESLQEKYISIIGSWYTISSSTGEIKFLYISASPCFEYLHGQHLHKVSTQKFINCNNIWPLFQSLLIKRLNSIQCCFLLLAVFAFRQLGAQSHFHTLQPATQSLQIVLKAGPIGTCT